MHCVSMWSEPVVQCTVHMIYGKPKSSFMDYDKWHSHPSVVSMP